MTSAEARRWTSTQPIPRPQRCRPTTSSSTSSSGTQGAVGSRLRSAMTASRCEPRPPRTSSPRTQGWRRISLVSRRSPRVLAAVVAAEEVDPDRGVGERQRVDSCAGGRRREGAVASGRLPRSAARRRRAAWSTSALSPMRTTAVFVGAPVTRIASSRSSASISSVVLMHKESHISYAYSSYPSREPAFGCVCSCRTRGDGRHRIKWLSADEDEPFGLNGIPGTPHDSFRASITLASLQRRGFGARIALDSGNRFD